MNDDLLCGWACIYIRAREAVYGLVDLIAFDADPEDHGHWPIAKHIRIAIPVIENLDGEFEIIPHQFRYEYWRPAEVVGVVEMAEQEVADLLLDRARKSVSLFRCPEERT